MNSLERREVRYQRRKEKRDRKRNAKLSRLGGYDDVFTYERLYEAFYSCEKGVRWKGSVQKYEATLPLSSLDIYKMMRDRKFKPLGFLEFDLNERGKMRHIRALNISERCIQRVLCDYYLSPLINPQLIYDNGASIKGKGVDFAIRRLKCHLSRYYRKHHTNEGYVLQYDFSSYFDNINHEVLLEQFERIIPDKEIYQALKQMIDCFGKRGLGLGSQVSQIAAIFYPTLLDRAIKERFKAKGYERYMDDGIIVCHTLDEIAECKKLIIDVCKKLDITINEKKLIVSKISKTFIFLKKRIRMTSTGKIIVRIGREAVIRARRRLRKLYTKLLDEKSSFDFANFFQCYSCWKGMTERFDNYYIIQNYRKLFLTLTSRYNEEVSLCSI